MFGVAVLAAPCNLGPVRKNFYPGIMVPHADQKKM